ncbi:MAG: hypothetical protein GIW95_08540 [Candidatus Eremiobacteraeota bacterium]|nr:hypothetical protein [Candidatus Eremiobacteraeota bacterium]
MRQPRTIVVAAAFVLSCASVPAQAVVRDKQPPLSPRLSQLAQFAVASVEREFTQRGNRWYAACPYALGTYSYVELSELRRSVRAPRPTDDEQDAGVVQRIEVTLHAQKARFYWAAGKVWKDYGIGPTLRYFAEYRKAGGWSFEADQHVCARGEPQKKPDLREVPHV